MMVFHIYFISNNDISSLYRYGGETFTVPTPQNGLASELLQKMTDIYYGRAEHSWVVDVEMSSFTNSRPLSSYTDANETITAAILH